MVLVLQIHMRQVYSSFRRCFEPHSFCCLLRSFHRVAANRWRNLPRLRYAGRCLPGEAAPLRRGRQQSGGHWGEELLGLDLVGGKPLRGAPFERWCDLQPKIKDFLIRILTPGVLLLGLG